jgi:hypothetical protein
MRTVRQTCKAYYAADVKRIMPPNWAGGVDNHPIGLIIRVSIRTEVSLAGAGSGGFDAYGHTERPEMYQPACVRQSEPASGTGQRCPFSSISLLRSPRSGTSQIRDAAPGQGHRTAGWGDSSRLRVLASEAGSIAKTLRGGGTDWAATARQGASASSQADRRGAGFCPGNVESGARNEDDRVAAAGSRAVWLFGASPQYRTGAGAVPKKRQGEAPPPAATRSTAECAKQYEILRSMALEIGENATGNALELAYLECRGVAAWMAYVPPGAVRGEIPTVEAATPDCDLIRSLANLVLGDRLEAQDD